MANLRQSILIRTDLALEPGLLSAQVAHLHAQFMIHMITNDRAHTQEDLDWMKDPYIFVHKVPNLEVLRYFQDQAATAKIPQFEWTDTIYLNISPKQTRAFENVPVGISLGPVDSDKIKAVIGDLPLL
jgi:peptidyl-tRNA hydrolase